MINIVIPMAGRGSRFSEAGFKIPKPMIPVFGVPMIKLVINNLRPQHDHRFIFLCLRDHMQEFDLQNKLSEWSPGCEIVVVEEVTDGAACTVLLAEKYIDNEDQLMIANSDQWIDIDINDYLGKLIEPDLDGLIMTMYANDNKWSFVKLNDLGYVIDVVEKEVISTTATVGIYNFKKGSDFCRYANLMIKKGKKVNGEYYVAPVYLEMIGDRKNIGVYDIGRVGKGMHGLGTPEDLSDFLECGILNRRGLL